MNEPFVISAGSVGAGEPQGCGAARSSDGRIVRGLRMNPNTAFWSADYADYTDVEGRAPFKSGTKPSQLGTPSSSINLRNLRNLRTTIAAFGMKGGDFRLSGSSLQVSASSGQVSGSFRQVSESFRQVSGSSRQVSGSFGQVSGSFRQLSGSSRQVNGSFVEADGSSVQPERRDCCPQITQITQIYGTGRRSELGWFCPALEWRTALNICPDGSGRNLRTKRRYSGSSERGARRSRRVIREDRRAYQLKRRDCCPQIAQICADWEGGRCNCLGFIFSRSGRFECTASA